MRPDSCPLARTNGLPRPTGRGYRLPAPALENLAQCGRRCESSTRIRLAVPARYLGLGDALDTDQVRSLSEGDLLPLRTREDAGGRGFHDVLETRVHSLLGPRLALEVLYPFEIGDRHSAARGQDVGQDRHTAVGEDRVRLGRDRVVRLLEDDLRGDLLRAVLLDALVERGGDEHGAVDAEEVVARDGVGALEADDAPRLVLVREDLLGMQALRVVDRALAVGEGHDRVADVVG